MATEIGPPPRELAAPRRALKIVAGSVALAVLFGVVHDSIDVRISPDFYRIYKHAPEGFPIVLWAPLIGAASSWWVGLFLGISFERFASLGSRVPLPLGRVFAWMVIPLAGAALASASAARCDAYLSHIGLMRDPDPIDLVGSMHVLAYSGGFAGGLVGCIGVYLSRRRQPEPE